MAASIRAGDVLASRYRMVDLLVESDGSWIWNAHDRLLHRPVAVHLIERDDPRAEVLMQAARGVSALNDRRMLKVLDCNRTDTFCYVVNEWSQGTSLDIALEANGPMPPVRAAWLVHEVADIVAAMHAVGVTHGHVSPEAVMIDENGEIRVIGTGIEAALLGLPIDDPEEDVHALAGLLYATLTGRWAGRFASTLPEAPHNGERVLRPRQVRAGIPRTLDSLCDALLNGVEHASADSGAPEASSGSDHSSVHGLGGALGASLSTSLGSVFGQRDPHELSTAAGVRDTLEEFLGAYEPEMSLPVQAPVVPPDEIAPVERPWQPPEELVPAPLPSKPTPSSPTAPGAATTPTTGPTTAPTTGPVPPEDDAATAAGTLTSAGIPVFRDSGDVDWAAAPTGRPSEVPSEAGATPDVGDRPARTGAENASAAEPDSVSDPDSDSAPRPLFASDEATQQRRERLAEMTPAPADEASDAVGKHRAPGESVSTSSTSGGRRAARSAASSAGYATGTQHKVPEEYWSWETSAGQTGSGLIPVVPGGPVPGRNWLRLAWVIGVGALVLLLVVGFLQASSPERSDESETPSTSSSPSVAEPVAFTGLSARDFDPRDSSGEEYPQDAPKAVDGDLSTFWGTSTYKQQLGPGGLKDGVGMVVDLGQPEVVREVQVAVLGGETTMQVFVSDEDPSDVDSLESVGSGSTADELVVPLDQARTARFVTVWLTTLPAQDGGFRGKIAEISVLG